MGSEFLIIYIYSITNLVLIRYSVNSCFFHIILINSVFDKSSIARIIR